MVSIIIPVHNAQEFIRECLTSILRQSYTHIEIILVDDASADDSVDKAHEVLTKGHLPWCMIRHDTNKGVSVARNEGIAKARGEYLYFLDADDYISPDCIALFVAAARKDGSDIVYANHMDVHVNGSEKSRWLKCCDACYDEPIIAYAENKLVSMVGNHLVRRYFYVQTGVRFKENVRYEDEMWSLSLVVRAKRVSSIKEITYYYRRWEGAFTGTRVYDAFKMDCLFLNLRNCHEEGCLFSLWENKSYCIWYARALLSYFRIIMHHEQNRAKLFERIDCVFRELCIPHEALNQISRGLYSVLRKCSFLFPRYAWIKALVKVQEWKNKMAR